MYPFSFSALAGDDAIVNEIDVVVSGIDEVANEVILQEVSDHVLDGC